MDRLLPRPTSVLDRRAHPSFVPASALARQVAARSVPVLRCERASRQLSLPFFAPLGVRAR